MTALFIQGFQKKNINFALTVMADRNKTVRFYSLYHLNIGTQSFAFCIFRHHCTSHYMAGSHFARSQHSAIVHISHYICF